MSVHAEDLREREKEKKDLESELRELRLLPLLPGLGPWIAQDRLFEGGGGVSVSSGRTMEEEGGEREDGLFIFLLLEYPIWIPNRASWTNNAPLNFT